MPKKTEFRWQYNTLNAGLAAFVITTEMAIGEAMDHMAEEIQNYAQQNAPWEDRTGEARSGLTAEASQDGMDFIIDLFHTADYGVWLEVRWSGKYAIIVPTIETMGPVLMNNLRGILTGLDFT